MSVPIYEKIANNRNYGAWRNTNVIRFIVMHYTGNDGDSDTANANYFQNNIVKASAHYFVDDNSITRSVPDNYVAWSVGGSKYSDCATTGGGKFYGVCTNTNSISVEMCDSVRNGRFDVSDKTLKNAVWLVRQLMQKYNVPIDRVICHFDVNGKRCPNFNNGAWILGERADFKKFKQMLMEDETTMTESLKNDINKMIDNKLAGYNSEPSDWAVKEGTIKKAIAAGITTNGERPQGYTKREESFQVGVRIIEKCTQIIEDAFKDAIKECNEMIQKELAKIGDDGK